jgi:hypothetical protein
MDCHHENKFLLIYVPLFRFNLTIT